MKQTTIHPRLADDIRRLAAVRQSLPALRCGKYEQLHLSHEQFAFGRYTDDEYLIVAINAGETSVNLEIPVPQNTMEAVDMLNLGERFKIKNGRLSIEQLYPRWGRVLKITQ